MTVEELRERRHTLARECRSIIDRATAAGRGLTQEDRDGFDKRDAEICDIDRRLAAAGIDEDRSGGEPGGDLSGLDPGRSGPTRQTGFALGREQRMAEWHTARGVRSEFSPDEGRDFSLGRAVRGMVTGQWTDADLERRALGEGADSTGGVLVPESLASFAIDRVRKRARVLEAGARTVPMDSDDVSIPRLSSGVVPAWRNENTAVAESDPGFERVRFVAKTLAVIVKLSYELFEDMSSQSSDAIGTELIGALSLELDRVALRGSGVAPEPRGIRNQAGVEIQSLGANGLALTNYDPLIDGVAGVLADNITPNAQIVSSRTAATLAKLKDNTGQPLQRPPMLDNVTELVSNQVPGNIVQGTSNDTSEVYTGDFTQLLIGMRPQIGVRLKSSDQPFMGNMQVALLAWLRADVQLAHPEAFAVTTGVRA